MNASNAAVPMKNAVPGGGIKKSLLTPCRRIGLSKRYKSGSFKSPLTQENVLLNYDSPPTNIVKETTTSSLESTLIAIETKRKNETPDDSKSKRPKRDTKTKQKAKKRLIDNDSSDDDTNNVNILNVSGCDILRSDEKSARNISKDGKKLAIYDDKSPKSKELYINLQKLPSDIKSIKTNAHIKTTENDEQETKEIQSKNEQLTKDNPNIDVKKNTKLNEESKKNKKGYKLSRNNETTNSRKTSDDSSAENEGRYYKTETNTNNGEDKASHKLEELKENRKTNYMSKKDELSKQNGKSNTILKENNDQSKEIVEDVTNNFNNEKYADKEDENNGPNKKEKTDKVVEKRDQTQKSRNKNTDFPILCSPTPTTFSPKTIVAQLETKPLTADLDDSLVFEEKPIKKSSSKSKSSIDDYIKRKEKQNNHSNSSSRKLSMKKSSTMSDDFESDEEFLGKTNSQTSNPETKNIDKSDLINNILELEKVVANKEGQLERYRQAEVYHKLHDVENLESLTKTWKGGCENALQDLLLKLKEQFDIDMQGLLKKLGAPSDLIKYDEDNGIFL